MPTDQDDQNTVMYRSTQFNSPPDPTILTTQQLGLAIAALEKQINTRLDAMDKAMVVFSDNINRVPTATDRAVGQLKAVIDETFKTVQEKFITVNREFEGIEKVLAERKDQLMQATIANNTAIAAAFNAADKASDKQTQAFQKRMDELVDLIQTANKTTDDKISDIKDRVTGIEQRSQGAVAAQATQQTLRTD